MDITRGSLEDISRPASSERSRAGSRVSSVSLQDWSRLNQDSPRLLLVLSPEVPDTEPRGALENDFSTIFEDQIQLNSKVELINSEMDEQEDSVALENHSSESGNEDSEVEEAITKMRRLDKILAQKISKEKAIKKKGKELQQKLRDELQELKTKGVLERADEVENTRLFLALDSASMSSSSREDGDFVPVFSTQVADDERSRGVKNVDECCSSMKHTQEEGHKHKKVAAPSESRQSGADRGAAKQDFVKRNIELARDAGSQVLMTEAEKQRVAELLRDLDEAITRPVGDEADESMQAMTVPAGQGYTPEPEELDQLRHINSRLQLLVPIDSFASLRSLHLSSSSPQMAHMVKTLRAAYYYQRMEEPLK